MNGFANRPLNCLIGTLQARLEIGDLEGLIIILGKKLSCKIRGTLEIGVFVAMANDLVLILRGEGLQAVIKGNEAEKNEKFLRTTLRKSHFGMVLSCKFAAYFQKTFFQEHH